MSIASEITRLQTAKSDLKTSIENKGVSVSASATLDDYADYVDLIPTGQPGTEDLLWTNPTPAVEFAPQTVNLSGNLTNYQYVKIGFKISTSDTNEFFDIVYRSQLPTTVTTSSTFVASLSYRATSYYYVRAYGAPTSTSIIFSDSIRQTTTLNTSLIPLHIYGVNF